MNIVDRAAVRKAVKECKKCSLCGVGDGPVPFSAPVEYDGRIAVVGEAPGKVEDKTGKPLVGPSGQLARQWLAKCGVNDVDVAFLNVVSCWPNRTPTPQEVASCRENVIVQLGLLSPSYVLVLGGVALSALCPQKTRISEARGYWWKPNWNASGVTFAWAMATWHPAAVLRNNSLEREALDDVEHFTLIAREEMEPVEHQFCLKCKKDVVDRFTDCGLGYCARCYTLVS
jgi:DNA polymerase